MTTNINVGAGAVLGVAAVVAVIGAAWYLKKNAGAIVDSVNPASQNNLAWKGVNAAAGESRVASASDYIFGGIDLINPWNESDVYAKTVYGLGEQ